jgi:integrase
MREFADTHWSAILKRAGVTHRSFYQCRHTYATLLLAAGADWTYIADQIGHANLMMPRSTTCVGSRASQRAWHSM